MKNNMIPSPAEARKEFLRLFKQLCYSRTSWQVWANLMSVFACSIANSVERDPDRREAREKEYAKTIEELGGMEIPAKMFALLVTALERKPEQDFLGEMFMELNLGNHWKGQFFTPYSVCKLMAELTIAGSTKILDEKGWVSINDCCCGAGAILIAAAHVLNKRKLNFQTDALFVAQDIDRVAGQMCYVQLSLQGCAGYVVIADSLTKPVTGNILIPTEQEGQEFWFTPMYYRDCWQVRKAAQMLKCLLAE